ncbi:MAG: hypothetical protein U0T33_02665 [Bacteroidales bacterium]
MKRLILITVLLAMVSAVSFGEKVVAKGQSFSALGDYKVVKVDDEVPLMGKDCQAYTIKYENSPIEVRIIVCKEEKCRRYLVLSDKLSVQYVCNKAYFGIERLDKKFEAEGYVTSDRNLNKFEYFHQKVLGSGQKSELEATALIAAYFPHLLAPEEPIAAR